MAPYQYKKLEEPRQTRLLHLLPGTGELYFNLESVNLDDNPEYEAISYCWGNAKDTRAVCCEKDSLQITVSLFSALKQLRFPDRPRTLWADAVCINQDDIVEKGVQVKLMSQIYSKTSRILIWLGEDEAGLEGVRESVAEALALLPPDTYDGDEIREIQQRLFRDTSELRKQGKPNINDHDWASINHLFLRPWFERKWIIQEVAMAPDDVPRLMICGDIELSWSDLASLAYRLCAYGVMWSVCGLSVVNGDAPHLASFWIDECRPQRMASNAFMIMLIKYYRSRATLLDCFIATVTFQCSNHRDHIYALLNIVSAGLEPDYSLSVEAVWERFGIKCLVDDQNLKFLALNACMGPDKSSNLPSWVPVLDGKITSNSITSYTIRPQCFHAGGPITPLVTVSANNRLLHLSGRIIDTVKATTRSLTEIPFPSEADVLPMTGFSSQVKMWKRNWFQECRDLAADGDWSNLSTAKKRAFLKTMICEMTGMRDPAPEELIDAVEVYLGYNIDYFTPGYVLSETVRDIILTHGGVIEHSILSFVSNLRFCTTQEQRFGQVSKEAKPGDLICVLLGAEIPYILRAEKTGNYQLVGQCYLHGVMQGETLLDGKYETQPIILE
ncbi:heterokaryon incompatibility protein-domain-containing protein [Dactylonectria macrodidyma]|uniref:Heterokaryon incompatibility protein-domain-containing protein n=1 Tax=Dactylonectria macrodidyma TaxID=307937 RepID=A0A9P9IH97_9HYPO|nr:heterokaryon incompatibility protein-domain-containing protein [Dactylonectria macrodidyma]